MQCTNMDMWVVANASTRLCVCVCVCVCGVCVVCICVCVCDNSCGYVAMVTWLSLAIPLTLPPYVRGDPLPATAVSPDGSDNFPPPNIGKKGSTSNFNAELNIVSNIVPWSLQVDIDSRFTERTYILYWYFKSVPKWMFMDLIKLISTIDFSLHEISAVSNPNLDCHACLLWETQQPMH